MEAVSVLLSTFNGALFLEQQLSSILNQEEVDLQLIAADDGSTDRTLEILKDFAATDRRLIILADGANRGQRVRLSQALTASQNPLIAISDQDDIWDLSKLKILSREIGDHALIFSRSQLIDQHGADLGRSLLEAFALGHETSERLVSLIRPMVSAHAALVRRPFLRDAAFFQAIPHFDHLMALDAHFSKGIAYIDAPLVLHRIHNANQNNGHALSRAPGRLTKLKRRLRDKKIRQFEFIIRVDFLSSSPIIPSEHQTIFREVGLACKRSWLRPAPQDLIPGRLARRVSALVEQLAGNPNDLAEFLRHFASFA